VVTSPVFTLSATSGTVIKAFFVVEGVGGAYRGALVRGPGAQVDDLGLGVGTEVNLQVRTEEYAGTGNGTETQLYLLGGTVVGTSGTVPGPTAVAASAFANDAIAEAYEGVLVRVSDVTSSRFDSGAVLEYGAFRLGTNLIVDDLLYAYPAGLAETFSSITGFLRYSYDGKWAIVPRDAADVVSSGNPRHVTSVTVQQVQDPANAASLPHCVPPSECDPIAMTNLVVTSPVRVADKDGAGVAVLYAVYVQDASALDGNAEPLPYSGVRLVFPGKAKLDTTFALTTYGDFSFPDTRDHPEEWPAMGDVIAVEGSPQEYFDMTQVGLWKMNKLGTVTSLALTAPKGKSFAGDALAGIATGHPGVTDCESPTPAGPDAEKWEGVLLTLQGVTTTLACVPTTTYNTSAPSCVMPDYSYFQVTGGVEIGTSQGWFAVGQCPTGVTCTCDGPDRRPNDTRALGQNFTSITGIYDYTYSVYRLNPRGASDVVVAQ
jgi:hypothetical protein